MLAIRRLPGVVMSNRPCSVVSDAGTRPYPWKWQLHRSGEPMGVKLSEGGFISRSAAELAGTRAVQQFLEFLDQEERRKG
jgi:hypothetical protein